MSSNSSGDYKRQNIKKSTDKSSGHVYKSIKLEEQTESQWRINTNEANHEEIDNTVSDKPIEGQPLPQKRQYTPEAFQAITNISLESISNQNNHFDNQSAGASHEVTNMEYVSDDNDDDSDVFFDVEYDSIDYSGELIAIGSSNITENSSKEVINIVNKSQDNIQNSSENFSFTEPVDAVGNMDHQNETIAEDVTDKTVANTTHSQIKSKNNKEESHIDEDELKLLRQLVNQESSFFVSSSDEDEEIDSAYHDMISKDQLELLHKLNMQGKMFYTENDNIISEETSDAVENQANITENAEQIQTSSLINQHAFSDISSVEDTDIEIDSETDSINTYVSTIHQAEPLNENGTQEISHQAELNAEDKNNMSNQTESTYKDTNATLKTVQSINNVEQLNECEIESMEEDTGTPVENNADIEQTNIIQQLSIQQNSFYSDEEEEQSKDITGHNEESKITDQSVDDIISTKGNDSEEISMSENSAIEENLLYADSSVTDSIRIEESKMIDSDLTMESSTNQTVVYNDSNDESNTFEMLANQQSNFFSDEDNDPSEQDISKSFTPISCFEESKIILVESSDDEANQENDNDNSVAHSVEEPETVDTIMESNSSHRKELTTYETLATQESQFFEYEAENNPESTVYMEEDTTDYLSSQEIQVVNNAHDAMTNHNDINVEEPSLIETLITDDHDKVGEEISINVDTESLSQEKSSENITEYIHTVTPYLVVDNSTTFLNEESEPRNLDQNQINQVTHGFKDDTIDSVENIIHNLSNRTNTKNQDIIVHETATNSTNITPYPDFLTEINTFVSKAQNELEKMISEAFSGFEDELSEAFPLAITNTTTIESAGSEVKITDDLEKDTVMEEAEALVIQDVIPQPKIVITHNIPVNWRDEESKLVGTLKKASVQDINKNMNGSKDVLEADKSIRMWWYDAYKQSNGQLDIFGKILDKTNKKYVSCCVSVKETQREMYVLPREHKVNQENVWTKEAVTLDDVKKELEELLEKKSITDWNMEICTRKYAFELPDIPKETQYIKLNYSYSDYEFPVGTSGSTFSHMFGTTVNPLKQFIIKHDIMGPCWLQFKNCDYNEKKESWCAVELTMNKFGSCSVMKDDDGKALIDGPPLNIMSLSVHTKMNHTTNYNEIIAISGFNCPNVDIHNQESATSSPFERFSITRRVHDIYHSRDIIQDVIEEEAKTNMHIYLEDTEETLLYSFLAKLQLFDADVIIAHDFSSCSLDILLSRMKFFNVKNWSRLGKRRTDKWPGLQTGAGGLGTSYGEEQLVMSGRLVCDTFIASQDLVTCKSYQLTDMALSELGIIRENISIEETNPSILEIELSRHTSFDAYISFELAMRLQILPLTKQLTNLSGNLWSRSMNGARAERNEYLLTHTFYNNKFICPDKSNSKNNNYQDRNLELEKHNNESEASLSFEGGLVLEPKSGYYDGYVLLLDFNSLYPSIMQEYNVCFTTMDRQKTKLNYDFNDIPSKPSADCPEGILPRLVRMFVNQRKRVKELMKAPNLSKTTKKQYNIEQMALKLTANSMYGCLGSPISSFYARPLAMFITSMGREILRSTVDLTTQMGFNVIYGDTDSIMIETKQKSLSEAILIGKKIKEQINKNYKYLEIDMDGVFKHTLLLKKKKYAGILVKEKSDGSGIEESVEAKGLDLVRRDGCQISREVSQHVLGLILSDKDREGLADIISAYLKDVASKIHNSIYTLDDFIIRKQLSKAPELYEKKSMPHHVKVARSMRRKHINVKANDIIAFVMCKSNDPDGIKQEPCMPEDVRNGTSEIDLCWYLENQIIPPVQRLCQFIPGVDFSL